VYYLRLGNYNFSTHNILSTSFSFVWTVRSRGGTHIYFYWTFFPLHLFVWEEDSSTVTVNLFRSCNLLLFFFKFLNENSVAAFFVFLVIFSMSYLFQVLHPLLCCAIRNIDKSTINYRYKVHGFLFTTDGCDLRVLPFCNVHQFKYSFSILGMMTSKLLIMGNLVHFQKYIFLSYYDWRLFYFCFLFLIKIKFYV